MSDKIKCKVVGTQEIDGVPPGEEVELDPTMINVRALVYAGLVEVVSKGVDVNALPDPTPDRRVRQAVLTAEEPPASQAQSARGSRTASGSSSDAGS
ncbi:hypothetical protein [Nonomuraea soli]|uniref:Uncharacterized protein n=1 Tax=Nonomuraea soli TaxID=1032476 RepID=A0A7W0CUG1_9ACTN|nr:hypothetical protein [Nonomuraea soli]MBA2897393.1 hypothetical protein [Nonomuraea soli]